MKMPTPSSIAVSNDPIASSTNKSKDIEEMDASMPAIIQVNYSISHAKIVGFCGFEHSEVHAVEKKVSM